MQFQTCFSMFLTIKEKKEVALYIVGEEIFSCKDWFLNSLIHELWICISNAAGS